MSQAFCEVSSTIGELHQRYMLAHLDIQTCFNKQFEPVCINFDHCEVAYQQIVQNALALRCMIDSCKSKCLEAVGMDNCVGFTSPIMTESLKIILST